MCWKYYTLEQFLLVVVSLLCLAPSRICEDVSQRWAVNPGEYPFLVLVENPSYSGDSAQYLTGILTSLSYVLTLSNALAQLPSGLPNPLLRLRVYAGLTDLSQLASSAQRDVIKITNELLGRENQYFPNLVILQLKTPFHKSSLVQPGVFNVGMLSPRSTLVGWAHLPGSNITLSYAVAVQVIPRTSTRCNGWQIVEFQEQMCCYDLQAYPLRLNEGALLVDQHSLTAIKQFDTYLKSHLSTTVALFVRTGHFMDWIQNIVSDPVPSTVYLQTKFADDDIDPQLESSNASRANHINFWDCLLLATAFVLTLFMLFSE